MACEPRIAQMGTSIAGTDGSRAWTAIQSHGGFEITNVGAPTAGSSVARLSDVTALQFLDAVDVKDYTGTATVAEVNAIGSPATGQSVVMEDAGTPSVGASDLAAIGDVFEFDGTSWKKIIANSGGVPPTGTRAHISTSEAFITGGGLTAAADEGKIAEWAGALTPGTLDSPADGDVFLVKDGTNDNKLWSFQGAVPTGAEVQISNIADAVTSVFGRTGVVTAAASDYDAVQIDNTPAGSIAATNVQAAIDELDGDITALVTGVSSVFGRSGAVTAVGGDYTASEVTNVPAGSIAATDVQAAINELDGDITALVTGVSSVFGRSGVVAAVAGDYTASEITNVAAGNIAAITVQAAIDELDGEKLAITAESFIVPDNKNESATSTGSGTTTGLTIAKTPTGHIDISVNGIMGYGVGDGVKTTDFYYSADGGTTARALSAIVAGDTLYQGSGLFGNLSADCLSQNCEASGG